ncbi:MAG: exodeoxyribonuclease VII small subunit [Propionibacteriaceae bacterium]|jgi:exodeoxyribonuclease VII small subunit|nr:exodeoxyribonuclease VII small subunit [Propionibacteriaceae bacterium]
MTAKGQATPTDTEEFDYETAKGELAELVAKLESGQVPLSQAVELWERGERLASQCQQWLDEAKARVAAAAQSADDADEA